jgi:hypothetical protein
LRIAYSRRRKKLKRKPRQLRSKLRNENVYVVKGWRMKKLQGKQLLLLAQLRLQPLQNLLPLLLQPRKLRPHLRNVPLPLHDLARRQYLVRRRSLLRPHHQHHQWLHLRFLPPLLYPKLTQRTRNFVRERKLSKSNVRNGLRVSVSLKRRKKMPDSRRNVTRPSYEL